MSGNELVACTVQEEDVFCACLVHTVNINEYGLFGRPNGGRMGPIQSPKIHINSGNR